MGTLFALEMAAYQRTNILAALRGKVDIGPYDAQHLNRYAMIVREILKLSGDDRPRETFRTLDFGSLTGILSLALKTLGYEMHCVDVEPIAAEYGSFYEKHDLRLQALSNGYRLPYEDGFFDCVIFSEVLEHLYDSPLEILLEFKRILKPDGHLVLTTPNVMRIENKLKFLLNINIYQDIERYVYYPRYALHFREYSRKDLRTLLEEYVGYHPVQVKMFDFAAGRSPLRRAIQRILYAMNAFLPMFKGTLLAVAKNDRSRQPRLSMSAPPSSEQA